MKIIQNMDSGISELVDHKNNFIFSGDQQMLNKIFSNLKMDMEREHKKALKFKPFSCTCGA